jgi:hypothetical protein
LVPQPSPKTSQFPQLLQIFFLCKSPTWIHLLLYCLPNRQQVLSVEQFPPIDLICSTHQICHFYNESSIELACSTSSSFLSVIAHSTSSSLLA